MCGHANACPPHSSFRPATSTYRHHPMFSTFFRRFAVSCALLLAVASSHALVPLAPQYKGLWPWQGTADYVYGSSADAVCAAMLPGFVAQYPAPMTAHRTAVDTAPTLTSSGVCGGYATYPVAEARRAGGGLYMEPGDSCPVNSTPVTGGCQCKSGFDESNGQCVPHTNQCTGKTGQVGILSWTEGYTRTPDEGDRQAVGPIMSPPPSGEVCDSGCSVSIQTSGPGVQPYVSQSPTSNGLYRRSVDYPSLGLGKECTAGTADAGAKKDAPPPECPGAVGDLGNGKPVCVGTAAKPITPTPLGAAPGAVPIAGNPPAGAKPPTGEGSGTGSAGRTPTTGSGTATGGPAAAAAGGKGGGAGGTATGTGATTNGEGKEEKDPCGAPGQAVCNVKVDETGTPAGAGTTFDSSKASLDQSAADTLQKINAARDRTDGPSWSFTFALPTGCAPYPVGFGGVVLNVCQYQGTIHDLLSMVWAAVTAFTIIGMVGRTIRGT